MTEDVATGAPSPPQVAVLVDFLSTDERPTAILQLRDPRSPHISYTNPALERIFTPPLRDGFNAWARTLPSKGEGSQVNRYLNYAGRKWHLKLLQEHHCAVLYTHGEVAGELGKESGDQAEESLAAIPEANNYDVFEPYSWVTDWTRFSCAAVNSWTKFLRTVAWEKTPVGPMESWSYELRLNLIMTMACGDARVIAWGQDEILFFNEAALPVVTQAAVPLLGFPIADMTGEKSQLANKRFIQKALATGTQVKMRHTKYVYHRHGAEEDVFCDFNLVPFTSKTGHYYGIQIEFTEVTSEVLEIRRKEIVSALLECIAASESLKFLWSGLQKVFEASQLYLPYTIIYVGEEDEDAGTASSADKEHSYRLRAATGIAADTFPDSVTIHSTSDVTPLAQVFNQSLISDGVTVLKLADGTLHPDLHIKTSNGKSVRAVYVLPIKARGERSPLGFILLGKDPGQPFSDEDTKMMEFIRDTIWKSASIIALPEDQRNKEELIDTNHRLAQELRILLAEVNESAFATLARDAPCGMYIVNPDGTPRFLNQTYLDMTGFSSLEQVKEISRTRSFWLDIADDEDSSPNSKNAADTVFTRNFEQGVAQRSEHRLVYPQDPGLNTTRKFNRWVEAVSLPVFDPVMRIQGIMGFMLDISDRKKAEDVQEQNRLLVAQQQAQKLQDALANKAAADNFIDTISHELRNPLSAILQVADGAGPTLELLLSNSSVAESADAVVEAVKTIVLCAQHMKTIVDDILTLSKLDSSLLTLLPERSNPHELALKALKMYESECLAAKIVTSLEIDDTYHRLSIDTVMMDPNRALQVLMNLVSNAVKFTRNSTTREITLRLAASPIMPTDKPDGVIFAKPDAAATSKSPAIPETPSEVTANPQEALFIQYTVVDTGRGIMQEEIERLFQRFSQASSKTYAHYGGSGMGLFISKKLSELHGGQIGMKSGGLGLGSTFTFFIKVARPAIQSMPSLLSSTKALSLGKDKPAATQPSERPRTAAVEKKMDILVVEDNIVNQTVTAKQLRRLNHTVHVADHGEAALAFLRNTNIWRGTPSAENASPIPISVVLMDVEMPIMDGLTCTRKIRELERDGSVTGHLPIIAVTANARDQQIEKVLESGADSVITKPFRVNALISAMADLVKDD